MPTHALDGLARVLFRCVVCALGATMLAPLGAMAAPEVALATAEPAQILIGRPAKVVFAADIGDPTFISGGANLLQVGPAGSNPTIVGVLRDDGTGGDEIAGDGRYSLEVTLNEPAAKQSTFRISAAFKGQLRRVNSVDIVVSALSNRPAVAVAGHDLAVPAGSVVTLDGRRSFDLDGDLISFEWSLPSVPPGSGASLDDTRLVMPRFTADVAGVYRASLVVRDGKDRSVASEVTIIAHAGNTPPTAVIGGELARPFGAGPVSVAALNGAASFDPEGSVLTNRWRLVSRPASSVSPALNPLTGGDTVLTADKPGRYRVELIVSDGSLPSAPVQSTVAFYAPNTAPITNAGDDQTVAPGTRVRLTGTASDTDGADGVPALAWAVISRPAGSIASLQEPTTGTPSFVADVAGDYLLELVARDIRGGVARDRVVVRADGAVDSDGDGVPDPLDDCPGTPRGAPVDAKGCAASQLPPVTISAFTANPASGTAPLSVAFSSQASGGTGIYSFAWQFGDGQTSTARNPTHVYGVAGTFTSAVTATDGLGSTASASIDVVVSPAPNNAPRFTSTPVTAAAVNVPYVYAAQATDPDVGDVLTFSLPTAPAGMTIVPASGSIQWTPAVTQSGRHEVVVRVRDIAGLFALQQYFVDVAVPIIIVPDVVGQTQAVAEAAIVAASLVMGAITTQNSATVAAGRVISQNPAAGTQAAVGAAVTLVVSLGPVPLVPVPGVVGQVQAKAQAAIVAAGFVVGAITSQNSAAVPAGIVISQNPAGGALATAGSAVDLVISLGPPPGNVDLDGDGFTVAQGDCNDADPSIHPGAFDVPGNGIDEDCNGRDAIAGDTTPPAVSIASPAEDALVTIPTDILGSATDANFLRYTLAIAGVNDTVFRVIGGGTSPVTGGVLGQLDPSLLENGMFRVRLTGEDANGQTSVDERVYRVGGEAKVGVLALSFVDLQVPVSGIPITVIRSYDNRVKTARDFGFGWSLNVKSGTYQNNRRPGDGWTVTRAGGPFGLPCKVVSEPRTHLTELRLSDREFYLFRPRLVGLAALVGGCVGSVAYEFVDGSIPGASLQVIGNADIIYTSGDVITEFDGTDDTGIVFNPQEVRLTTIDGRVIDFDRATGITRIRDGNGNALTITSAGIAHSAGTSIAFERDGQGRITRITDPKANALGYAYDASGDLTAFVDQASNRTTFTYDTQHNLIDIVDPLGNRTFTSEYDAAGRLIAMIDAKGRRIEFSYDLDARSEVITDARGNVQRLVYDENGYISRDERSVTIDGVQTLAVTTYQHDRFGNVLVQVDPDGVRTEAVYDHDSPLSSVVDPAGLALRTTYAYDAKRQPTSITSPSGETVTFAYTAQGNLRQWGTPLGGITTFTHDTSGNLTGSVDAAGAETRNVYDSSGNRVQETKVDGSGAVLSRHDYTYDANGNALTATEFRTVDGVLRGFATRYAYDAMNRVTAVTDADGGVSRTEYNALGLVAAEVDALGRRTEHVYDEFGAPIRVIAADGGISEVAYDPSGNVVQRTDAAGRRTEFTYDELDRRIASTRPDGSVWRSAFTAAGRRATFVDGAGLRRDFTYDVAGRRVRTLRAEVLDALSGQLRRPETFREWDASGRLQATVDAKGNRTTYAYAVAAGQQLRITYADGTTRQTRLDTAGRVVEQQDELGRTTKLEHDVLGRLIAVVDALGGRTTYQYDEAGNLLRQTDALGRTTAYRYDALNRRIETVLPGGQREAVVYDGQGNIVSRTDFNGSTTTFTYDAMNRVVAKRLHDGASVSYTYTPTGKRASETDSRGTTSYQYDVNDRRIRVTHPDGSIVAYAYDARGRLSQLATPSGAVNYGYDALNRLATVQASTGETVYRYDLAGNVAEVVASNGVVSRRSFDVRNRLREVRHTLGAGVLDSFAYDLAPNGRRVKVTEADGSVESYRFDALDRLLNEGRTGTNPRSISYELDAVGNRTRMLRNGVETLYAYDANDRLLTAGTSSYAYDANGNLVSQAAGGVTSTYLWDFENRLRSVTDPTTTTSFAYDVDGNLVARQQGALVTRFLVDANNPTGFAQVLEERDGAGALLARHVYGSERHATARNGTSSFPLHDGLGSTRRLTNGAGVVTDGYDYDAFGNIVASSGATANPYLFTGEQRDAALGFYNLRARWMDPATGRFVSRDPFPGNPSDPRTLHRHLYAEADPVNMRDPSGYFGSLAEANAVVAQIGNLVRLSVNLLNFVDKVQTGVEVAGLLVDLFSGDLNAMLDSVYDLATLDDINSAGDALPDPEEAINAFAGQLPSMTPVAMQHWGPYLFQVYAKRRPQALVIYLPNFLPTLPVETVVRPGKRQRIGKHSFPLAFAFGGPPSTRVMGGGFYMAPPNSRRVGQQEQVIRMDAPELHGFGLRHEPLTRPPAAYDHIEAGYRFLVMRPPPAH